MQKTHIIRKEPPRKKYLLYIDLLGFSDIVRKDWEKAEKVFSVIDSLNVHSHNAFHVVAFSDTILVYNHTDPNDAESHNYIVWYLIEFVEDLHHRLVGQNLYFRAIILYGDFKRYKLKNVDCFYGTALIDAYERHKIIPSIGLFIDSACNHYNSYFRTAEFGNNLHFIYLTRSLESLYQDCSGIFPVEDLSIDDGYPYLVWEIKFLCEIHKKMRIHPDPNVRTKFLTVWDFYKRRYPHILSQLEKNSFNLKLISKNHDWGLQMTAMNNDMRYSKNI